MSTNPDSLDALFREAVSAIDAGNEAALRGLLEKHPVLVRERLHAPGDWLREQVGDAVDGFFKQPYLLWFVAEDPTRNNSLPPNIAALADMIIQFAKREHTSSLQEQLDYALRLVAWSPVASKCGVQLGLIDVLVNAGASTEGISDDALVNGHFEAAEHLVKRGAKLTLATALCLEYWDAAMHLAQSADAEHKQFAFVLAALRGKAEAVQRLLGMGVDINKPSSRLYSHATPLHHAVWSGSMETVRLLVEAGADLNAVDTVYEGTPLGWAEHAGHEEIANYLREQQTN